MEHDVISKQHPPKQATHPTQPLLPAPNPVEPKNRLLPRAANENPLTQKVDTVVWERRRRSDGPLSCAWQGFPAHGHDSNWLVNRVMLGLLADGVKGEGGEMLCSCTQACRLAEILANFRLSSDRATISRSGRTWHHDIVDAGPKEIILETWHQLEATLTNSHHARRAVKETPINTTI